MSFALVVGGSGAIGSAIHGALEARGWKVLPTWSSHPVPTQSMHLDLGLDDFDSWVTGLRATVGTPKAVVFAAGINNPGPLPTMTADWFDRIMRINARGPLLLCKALWPYLDRGASITFIGSCSAQVGGPVTPHYAMSKAALTALTKNLALLGAERGIRANNLAPGWIAGPWVSAPPLHIPLGRLGTTKDVASVAAFLASDEASYITGQTIGVNGGAHFSC